MVELLHLLASSIGMDVLNLLFALHVWSGAYWTYLTSL